MIAATIFRLLSSLQTQCNRAIRKDDSDTACMGKTQDTAAPKARSSSLTVGLNSVVTRVGFRPKYCGAGRAANLVFRDRSWIASITREDD
jgi:hypothetical protein